MEFSVREFGNNWRKKSDIIRFFKKGFKKKKKNKKEQLTILRFWGQAIFEFVNGKDLAIYPHDLSKERLLLYYFLW